MTNGQEHPGATGYGGAPQRNPYAQNPYAQQAPYGRQNPYAQPVPQQQPYWAPQPPGSQPPYPAARFAAPQQPGALPGPLPRRNRPVVLVQFLLQWIYAPLWILGLVVVLAAAIFSDYGGDGPSSDGWLRVNRSFIPPRRLRAELSGRPEDWERYVTPVLERRIAAAEASHAAGGGVMQLDLSREVSAELAVRLYRGLGAEGVFRVAERFGWQGEPSGTTAERVRLVRRFPAPTAVSAPSPQDPPAAPGTPWGPQPGRFGPLLPVIFLLQIVYVPVYGLLTFWVDRPEPDYWERWGARWTVGPRAFRAEFTGSPAAWDRHVRRILKREATRELGRTADSYGRLLAPDGAFLRRIQLHRATYRGAGAHQALRIAAQQGWTLDPAFTPDPANSLRLCRPDHR
ncbi:hypothetical protein [Kitasatospora cathayae]|uniref:DUF4129 domain-containing protein n=1 Tax=Kitasatospora cathayae TaxID=3004092 RepID=A0ABY7Q5P5_9ACTN|nr:hypothetical protein [Kitasatospora sp. HUAS 3-15]WBP87979.1 hypothetical protein O1G21_20470 [Kitasatospora sp. HUAS 3-15]